MLRSGPLSAILNEEVALEGLEGSTIDTLWNHLAIRLKMQMPLPEKFCDSVWPLIVQNGEYAFYVLPESRKTFVFFDRMQHVDPATGVMKEPKEYPGHRFKYNPINADGVKGSCEHYDTRQPVAREDLTRTTCQEVDARWPNKFVIVASQKMREAHIIDPNCTFELTIIQYCMLEWIARSRFNGETSQGKFSLVELTKDSSILYYNRKFLTDCKLITRQGLCQRTGESSIQGMVYHLPRYYTEMKPKTLVITEKVVNILKQRPGYMADYDEIKHVVLGRAEARKWFRGNEFTKFIRTDETVPYRVLYPEADPREWRLKNKKGEEKQVRIMRLIDPEADVYDVWYKDEQPEDDQKDGILNSQKAYIDMPVLQQAYNVIALSGEHGVSQSALAIQMGLDRLNARAVVKNLVRLKAVEGHAVDEGRQRTTKYFLPGRSLRTVTFDREVIQLMSTHLNVTGGASVCIAAPTAQSSSSASQVNDLDEEHEEEKDRYAMEPNLYSAANTVMDSIAVEVNVTDEMLFLKKAQAGISSMMNTKLISAKMLRRCNQILELVKQYQVIEPRVVLKKINRDEKASGYKAEACHKSVLRLLGKLAVDKFLRIANVKLVKEDKELNVVYACDMGVDKDNTILLAKIEAAKARMLLQTPGTRYAKKQMLEADTLAAGHSYEGTLAKCLRMKLLHEFLFYLIYTLPAEAQEILPENCPGLDLSEVGDSLGPIYSVDDWKIFVPPLNLYESYGQGWALLTDVTVRLPLSIFCQICTFGFYTKELDHYLNHPIRRHTLIKQLPRQIRQQLFRQRKYIFNIFELCQKLCYAGLLQFGPQRMKDRDQTFIYLNKNTALLDTRSSCVGYQEIEDKVYPIQVFTLEKPFDLAMYWETLYKFAMETRLNRRSVAFGKEILVRQLQVKPEIIEAGKARTPEQAYENDVGRLPPGDGRGAAGMDTAMFVHLKSNWSKVMNYAPPENCQRAKMKRLKAMKKIVAKGREKPASSRVVIGNKRLVGAGSKDKKVPLKTKLMLKAAPPAYRKYGERKHSNSFKIRKIECRPPRKRKRNHYDEVDRKALRLMKKLRVDWSRNEDAILLTCRVAVKYLYGDVRNSNQIINSLIYRDILHWSDPNSANKTSRACQRRINYMVKHKPGVAANVKMCVEEARLNPVMQARFGPDFVERLKGVYPLAEESAMALKVHFVKLVFMLRKTLTKLNTDNFRTPSALGDNQLNRVTIPDTIGEFEQRFNVLQSHNKVETLNYASNPKQSEDIILLKLVTLIHSAVTNLKRKGYFNVQLFNVYKNYSERHLSQAMKMVRSFRLISLSRKLKMERIVATSIMPAWDNPYHVSISYINQIITKIPFEMFNYVYYNYLKLLDRPSYEEPVTFDDGGQGLMLLLAELLTMDSIDLDLEYPAEFIQMNPELKNVHPELLDEFETDEEPRVSAVKRGTKADPKSTTKIRFDTKSDVYFNYVMHPIEKLTKIPTEYLHFFCLLNSFRERIFLRTYKIDETYNVCTAPDCILQDSERNIISKCTAIAIARREIIERIKQSKASSRIELAPMLVVREDNIVQFFAKTVNEYGKAHIARQKRDLGRTLDEIRTPVNMVELVDEIVRFEHVRDFNWLDRYEITQLEEENTALMMADADPGDSSFSRDSHYKDDLSEKVHKLHNFYVVTYLKMNIRLKYSAPEELRHRVRFDNRDIPRCFLPEKFDRRQDILTRVTSDAIWPSREELQPLLEQASPLIYQNPRLCTLALYIEDQEQLGASVHDLAERFPNRAELMEDLQILLNFKFILRTGYRAAVYVHWRHAQSWLLRTSCVIHDAKENATEAEIVKQEPGTSRRKRPLEKFADDDEVREPPCKTRREEIERQFEEAEERDKNKPKKNLSLLMSPWVTVDGGVNRRLLYRWLTTLLLYCMSHPGVILGVIYSRFSMMAPVHLSYLLEILQEYGCVKILAMEVRQKKTLFSNYRPVKIEKATEFHREEHTYVEATPNALTTLTMFIGDYGKFQTDFMASPKYVELLEEQTND
ncbi:general transcription factor 3C polypeptide 1 [Toxorhynchites rutilus septentrionalis]|uniref:general transcription factor 3C polypeptide 1 n=1 Tax=Toxorhynchites rutilus septentrionalis TaxID=329112 RepID=UPI00247A33F4|nr:general transcription factor 3C polypeptide 1 [Toxorhynchites rutilus septentrionalis]